MEPKKHTMKDSLIKVLRVIKENVLFIALGFALPQIAIAPDDLPFRLFLFLGILVVIILLSTVIVFYVTKPGKPT